MVVPLNLLYGDGLVMYSAVVTFVDGRGLVTLDLTGANLVVVIVEVVFCENGISVVVDFGAAVIVAGFLVAVNGSVTGFNAAIVLIDMAIGL